ncbi:MAG: matrixin family metalloprotease [Parcubacteria group bacterium]
MSERRKIILGLVFCVTLLSLIGTIIFYPEARNFFFLQDKTSFCVTGEIPYGIGTIDPEFSISKSEFTEAVKKAETLWESALGKDVFVESTSPDRMDINLVFDDRQAGTIALKNKIEGINSAEGKYEAARNEYLSLSGGLTSRKLEIDFLENAYSSLKNELVSANTLYNAKVENYESEVAYWNARGGASEPEYSRIMSEKKELDNLYEQIRVKEETLKIRETNLNEKIAAYNELVSQVNTVAGMTNRLANSLNVGIEDYNRLQADREEFVTGNYKVQNGEKSIDVYQFYDDKDLVVILAHEMGHALGLPHATTEDSVMYPKMISQEAKLSAEDISFLKSVCK